MSAYKIDLHDLDMTTNKELKQMKRADEEARNNIYTFSGFNSY